jgi:hypothetical protein
LKKGIIVPNQLTLTSNELLQKMCTKVFFFFFTKLLPWIVRHRMSFIIFKNVLRTEILQKLFNTF